MDVFMNFDRVWGVEGVERLQFGISIEKHPSLDEIRQSLRQLILHVSASGNCEHVVQLFESALLGFRDEKEYHDQCHDVETTVFSIVS